jgi:PhnB protein
MPSDEPLTNHATVVTAPANSAFGQRGARIRDPFGNMWWITAQIEEVAVEPAMARLAQPQYAEQMRDAQETLDRELSRQRRAASPPRR